MHQRNIAGEILRRWVSSLCGPPNCFSLKRAEGHPQRRSHHTAGVVRLCALHWLQITRQRRQSAQRHRPFFVFSQSCHRAPVSPTPLARAPPRTLSSELLQGVLPYDLPEAIFLSDETSSLPSCPPETSPASVCPEIPQLSPGCEVSFQRIAELESLVEDLFQKITEGHCDQIDSTQRQEFAELLAEYAELVEELRISSGRQGEGH
jgi:hypothetical protein